MIASKYILDKGVLRHNHAFTLNFSQFYEVVITKWALLIVSCVQTDKEI